MASEAVRLLTQRALAVDSGFRVTPDNAAAVASIARRLDGMPLALELAAARLRVFDAQRLADLLNDRFRVLVSTLRTAPERHQTLLAAIGWSYDLLSPEEQALFRALSVFEGGFTLDAAERVGGESLATVTVLPALVDGPLWSLTAGRGRIATASWSHFASTGGRSSNPMSHTSTGAAICTGTSSSPSARRREFVAPITVPGLTCSTQKETTSARPCDGRWCSSARRG